MYIGPKVFTMFSSQNATRSTAQPGAVVPRQYVQNSVDTFRRSCVRHIKKNEFATQDKLVRIRRAISRGAVPDRLLASSPTVRSKAHRILESLLREVWRERTGCAPKRWYMVTMIDSRANALEYAPAVNLANLKPRVDRLLRYSGLNAVCVTELQPIINMPRGGYGGTLMFNVHALAWTTDPDFQPKKTEERLRSSTILRHVLDIRTVDIQSIADADNVRRCCAYLMKAPSVAKRVAPSIHEASGSRLMDATATPGLNARVLECLSLLEFPNPPLGRR